MSERKEFIEIITKLVLVVPLYMLFVRINNLLPWALSLAVLQMKIEVEWVEWLIAILCVALVFLDWWFCYFLWGRFTRFIVAGYEEDDDDEEEDET